MKHKGFTLSELMLAIAIVGIIAVLVLPMVNNNMPSRDKMMMKKAYYTITDVVSELINNEQYYPEIGRDGTYVGFDNEENVTGVCEEKPENSTEGIGLTPTLDKSCQGLYKFPKLFAKQLNVDGGLADNSLTLEQQIKTYQDMLSQGEVPYNGSIPDATMLMFEANVYGGVEFKTNDGMVWQVNTLQHNASDITAINDNGHVQRITVDVNGVKGPNCYQGSEACASRTKDFDQFVVHVSKHGKVVPKSGQTWFENAIGVDSSFSGD